MTQNNVQLQDGNGQLAGLRNIIINGAMQIWQRGVGQTGIVGYGSCDRFRTSHATVSITRTSPSSESFPSPYACDVTPTDGSEFITSVELPIGSRQQPLVVGSTWTLSFYTDSIEGITGYFEFRDDSNLLGTGVMVDTYGEADLIPGETIGSLTRYSYTFTIGATALASNICMKVAFGGPASGWSRIFSCVQLEPGVVATPFEIRANGLEQALCERYYQQSPWYLSGGQGYAGEVISQNRSMLTTMRAQPATTINVGSTTGAMTATDASVDASEKDYLIKTTAFSQLNVNGTAIGGVTFDAEL